MFVTHITIEHTLIVKEICLKSHRWTLIGFASKVTVGHGQYRNAVASGRRCDSIIEEYRIYPTLPRYGTDLFQAAS